MKKRKLCVTEGMPREMVLREMHDSPTAGHPGIQKTYKAIKQLYW